MNFGTPISMRSYTEQHAVDFRAPGTAAHVGHVGRLGSHLLEAIASTIPVLPVSLVATVFVRAPTRLMSGLEIKASVQQLILALEAAGAYVHIPRADRDYAISVGMRMLVLRHLVIECDGLYHAAEAESMLLQYYANGIGHFFRESR